MEGFHSSRDFADLAYQVHPGSMVLCFYKEKGKLVAGSYETWPINWSVSDLKIDQNYTNVFSWTIAPGQIIFSNLSLEDFGETTQELSYPNDPEFDGWKPVNSLFS